MGNGVTVPALLRRSRSSFVISMTAMSACRTDVLSSFDALVAKSLALSDADAFDGRLFVVGGEITRDRRRSTLFRKEPEPQGVDQPALIQPRDRIQPILSEDIEIRQTIGVEPFLGKRQLDDKPMQCGRIF